MDKNGKQTFDARTDDPSYASDSIVTVMIDDTKIQLQPGIAAEDIINKLRKSKSVSCMITAPSHQSCSFTVQMATFYSSYDALIGKAGCRITNDHIDCSQPQMNPLHQ
jgi:hypothetical protein